MSDKGSETMMRKGHQHITLSEVAHPTIEAKHFSTIGLIGLSYAILNTWTASSGSIYIGLAAGGPVSVVYGTIFGTFGAMMIAISLAEMCHVMPTKGAQYHWCYAFAQGSSWQRPLSFFSGWMGTAGWVALTSTAPYFSALILQTIIGLFHPEWVPPTWFTFVLYMGFVVYGTLMSLYGIKFTNTFNTCALTFSIVGASAIFVTLLAVTGSRGTMQSGKFIFATFLNFTGWPDGVAWIMGLLQTQYSLVGADGAAHIVDEIDNPRRNAPMAMVLSCAIGGTTALLVCIAFLAAITDPIAVIEAYGGAATVVFLQGLSSIAGATVLSAMLFGCQIFTAPALILTCSRMIHAFSIDGCLPFKRQLGSTSPKLEVPVWAILFNAFWLTVFGLLIFGSTLAILAVQSASVVMLQCSYVPVLILMLLRGRSFIRDNNVKQDYSMGKTFGPIANVIAICYIAVTTTFFLFPSVLPVSSASLMNYAVVVVAIAVILSVLLWYSYARRNFSAPQDIIEFEIADSRQSQRSNESVS